MKGKILKIIKLLQPYYNMLFVDEDRDGNIRSNVKGSTKRSKKREGSEKEVKREREILRHMSLLTTVRRVGLSKSRPHPPPLTPSHCRVRENPCSLFFPSKKLIMLPLVLPMSPTVHTREKSIYLYPDIYVYICAL